MKTASKTDTKVEFLLPLLDNAKSVLIAMQDNPDPDAIAAAVALKKIANTQADSLCTIGYAGIIGRAENRALVKYLAINFRLINEIDFKRFDLICLVDTQPGTGNNSLPANIIPDIVIDHHPIHKLTRKCRFTDIRRNYGSTSTILCEYLKNLNTPIDTQLATALLYGIRSDTQDLGREAIKADIDAIGFLYPLANKRMLGRIQQGSLDRSYFKMLADALKNANVFDEHNVVTSLENVTNPDMISEVADLLLRDDRLDCAICYGFTSEKMLLSIRTAEENQHADKLIKRIVSTLGTAGGHKTFAGGQIPLEDTSEKKIAALEKKINKKISSILRIKNPTPVKLIKD